MRKKSAYTQADLFGALAAADNRGWTELDRLRRRYSALERKMETGEYTADEVDEFHRITDEILTREKEAREAWAKSFGS